MRWVPLDEPDLMATLRNWRARWPHMGVLALLPEAEAAQVPLLQACCRELGLPLVGAIFPALVTATGFVTQGAWLLCQPVATPAFLLPEIQGEPEAAAQRIAQATQALLARQPPGDAKPTLHLYFDGLLGRIASILDELYLQLADSVDYAGVNAGSETFQPMPCLFDGERVIGNGVLGLLPASGAKVVLRHGYPAPEHAMTATATVGNRIVSIDWQPAFDAYKALIASDHGIALTRDNFYQYAVHYPFGIVRASGEVLVRIPVALDDDGALYCVGEVPENAMLVLLRAPEAQASGCVLALTKALGDAHGDISPHNLLTFYCAGRRMHLGDAALGELAELARRHPARELGGALTLGEIGSTENWGYPAFHNAAVVCTVWPGSAP
ncbi:MAG: FIST C-terminal domain-containing protein [Burkholderiales bacterium]|nr:FIST C-terminal domain-containing protein [Burkholderiales bacterium]